MTPGAVTSYGKIKFRMVGKFLLPPLHLFKLGVEILRRPFIFSEAVRQVISETSEPYKPQTFLRVSEPCTVAYLFVRKDARNILCNECY